VLARPKENVAPFAVILVAYDVDRTRAALRFCDVALRGLNVVHRVLVDNHPHEIGSLYAQSEASGWRVVHGSNTEHEFSGWQEGLDTLLAHADDALHVVFMNDTVASHRFFSRGRMRALRRSLAAMKPGSARLVGFTHPANGVFSVDGKAFQRWVSTYCFALSPRALQALGRRIFEPGAADHYILGGVVEERFLSERLSHALHMYFRWYLFRGGWYGSAPLDAASAPRLVSKARCMLLEHLLTVRCEQLGIEIVDPFDRRRRLAFLDRVARYVHRRLRHRVKNSALAGGRS
jgi:hypothetical protein